MKKCYRTSKYKRYNKRRGRKQEARRVGYKAWRRKTNRSLQGRPRRTKPGGKDRDPLKKYRRVVAPAVFSFVKNPDGVAKFVSSLERLFEKRKKVNVLLEDVMDIDLGAIVVLLSIMIQFKVKRIKFNGTKPRDQEIRHKLERSGFFKKLYSDFRERDRYDISDSEGIYTHAWKKVDSELGAMLIETASKTIWSRSRRCPGVQRVLIELMQNTNNHADETMPGGKHWWLSVHHNKKRKLVTFSFVDFGVGVFSSLERKKSGSKWFRWRQKLSKFFEFRSNTDVMNLILNGAFHSTVTEQSYRGKGLPGIADALRRGQISRLHIITNNVHVFVDKDQYSTLDAPFSGTFVSWQVGVDNEFTR